MEKTIRLSAALIITILLTLGLSLSLQSLLAAWAPPAGAPPAQNIAAPVYTEASASQTVTFSPNTLTLTTEGNLAAIDGLFSNQLNVGPGSATVAQGTAFSVLPSAHPVSERAGMRLDNWYLGQDLNGNGTKDFYLWQGAPANATRLYMKTTGELGIGNTDPTARLDISGGIRLRTMNCSAANQKLYTDASGNLICGTDQTGIAGESDPTVAASIKDGISWWEVSGIPGGFADGIDDVGGGIACGSVNGCITCPCGSCWSIQPLGTLNTGCDGLSFGLYQLCTPGGWIPYTNYIGPAGRCSCFTAGSRVAMADGTHKDIEDVRVGDKVKSANGYNTVVEYDYPLLTPDKDQRLMSINGGESFITDNHPVMTTDGWKAYNPAGAESEAWDILHGRIGRLAVGDEIVMEDGGILTVGSIEISKPAEPVKLYNFVLDGDNTYYVNGMLVLGFVPDKAGRFPIENEHYGELD